MKYLFKKLVLFFLALVLIPDSSAHADDTADVKKAAEAVLAAYSAEDAEVIAKHFVVGALNFSGDGRPGRPFDKGEFKSAFAAGLDYDLTWRDLKVEVYENSAVTTAFMDGQIRLPDGDMLFGPWRNSVTWIKEQGDWKVAHYHVSVVMPDIRGVQQLISRYHQAWTDRELDTALACIGDNYVRAIKGMDNTGHPTNWNGGYDAHDQMQMWMEASFKDPKFFYENEIEFLHTDINEQSGIVITRENGSQANNWGTNEWNDMKMLWWVAKIDGEWKIVGSLHNID